MTLGELSVALSCFVAARSAAELSQTRPYYRPIEKLLAANLIADLIGAAMEAHRVGSGRPFLGVARLTFHVQQAAGLVWPVGVASVALVVLARRPAWPAFVAGGVMLLARVALYPWLRQERLAWLLLGEQVALVALCAWAWWRFWKRERPVRIVNDEKREHPAPWMLEHHKALAWILFVEALHLVGPHLIGVANGDGLRITPGNPFQRWALAQIGYTALFAGLSIQQRIWRWRTGD